MQIFRGLIQSHLNYCSIVWGFTAKSNIESLFRIQKKGIRAIVPGFINYKYSDGELPGHTKPYFNEYTILGMHGVIVTNALLFIYKIRCIPSLLPISVRLVIADDAPIPGSTYETSHAWLTIYGDTVYRKSVFFKGPLLSINPNFIDTIFPETTVDVKVIKRKLKCAMFDIQSMGENEEWTAKNFILNNIPGLRSSARLNTYKYLAILKLAKVISRIIYFLHYTLRTKFALAKRCKKEYNFIWRFYILFILHFIYFTIYLFE